MLVDTHTHIVSSDTQRYAQRDATMPNGAWWLDSECSFDRLKAEVDASVVDHVILVQAAGPYGGDNSYLVDTLRQADTRFAGVGIIEPADDAATGLQTLADHRVAGLRLFAIPYTSPGWLSGERGSQLIDRCAELGLAVSVACQPVAFDDLGSQLRRRPDVTLLLDHCGFADLSTGNGYAAAQPLWDLAMHGNLVVKLTPTLVRINNADPHELVTALVDRFGADNIVWGSDWPQHREVDEHGQHLSYAKQVDLIQSWIGHLSSAQQQSIAGHNAVRLWPHMFNKPGAS